MKTVPFIDVNTSDHKPEDVKPNAEDLVKLHEETVKVRLHKLTRKTGVSPDLLFRCAEKSCGGFFSNFDLWLSHMRSRHHSLECNCPHCPTESVHSLTDYRKHFEQHRRHTYLCFHCPLTFARQQDVETHFSNSHKSLGDTMRMERFRFNISYSYFVAIQKDMLPTRSEFVLTLLGTLNRNLKELEENENQSFKRTWSASPQSANWLSEYTNSVSGSSSFFICGACFNYYDCRRDLSDHIRENHVARDVPVVSVKKSNQDTYHHTLELSFAKECVTFSTMRNCFCCEERDMRGDAFILHLKRHHKFVLHYFCDWCDLAITSLDFVDSHFKQCHVASNLKMRCQLTHKGEVLLVSLEDFRVQIPPTEKYSNISAVVKEEPQDNSNIDSSVMLLENDDIFLEDHAKYLESVADYSPKPRLKCISLKSLLKPTPPPSTIIPQNIQVVTSVRDPSLSSRNQFLQPKYQTTSGCGNLVLSTTSSNTIVPYIAKTTCAIQSTNNHHQIQSSTQNVQLSPMVDISANSSTATIIYPTQPGNESRYVAVPINRATITTSSYQSNPYQTLTTSFLNTHLNASTSASYVHNPIHPMYISSGEMKTLPSSNAVYGRVSSYDAMNTDRSS